MDAAHQRANAALVGRQAELTRVTGAVEALDRGQAGAVMIIGAAGMGKTSMIAQAVDEATRRGFDVVVATGYELSQTTPYAPIVSALRRRLHGADAAALTDGLGSLGLLFDDLDVTESPMPLSPELARARLQRSVSTVFRRLSRGRPLVLVFDDLHWMDASTIDVVHELFADLPDGRILLIGATRSVEGRDRADVRALLAAMRRSTTADVIEIGPLDDAATADLLRQWLGDEVPTGLVELVMDRTAGTPLLVETLMGALIDAGALRRGAFWWELSDREVRIPAAEDLLGTRIRQLSPDARSELAVLSVAGEPTSEAELEVDGLTAAERRSVLGQLRDGDLAHEAVGADGVIRWQPAHPLIAEVAAETMSITDRRDLHAKFFAESDGAPPERRARHLLGAGPLVDAATAVAIFADAGARALERGALVEAARFLSAAVEAQPDISAHPSLVGVHELLGDVWGRRGELDLAREHLVRAYREHERVGDLAAQVALVGRIDGATWYAGPEPILNEELAPLMERLRTEERWAELGGLAYWAMINLSRRGEFRTVRELSAVVIEAAERTDDARLSLIAENVRATEALWLRPPSSIRAREVVDHTTDIERRALEMGFVELADRSAHIVTEVGFATRLPDVLERCIAGERAVIDRSGRHNAWRLTMWRLVELIEGGDTAALDEFTTSYLGADIPRGIASVGSLIAPMVELDVLPVAPDEVVANVRAARDDAGDDRVARLLADVVEIFLLGERVAEDVAERLVGGHDTPSFVPSGSGATSLVAVARAHRRLGHTAAYREWIELLTSFDDGEGQLTAWAELLRAGDAATPPVAATHHVRAAERFVAVRRPMSAASCVLRALRLDRIRVDPALLDLAVGQLARSTRPERAAELVRLVGDRHLTDPARRAAKLAGGDDGGLTRREHEVAAAVASGLTNREVAEELFISVRTVTTHLERIYTKLGVTSRAELAARLPATEPSL